jgi:hypothetical protein
MVGLTPPAGPAITGNGLPHAATKATAAAAPEATEAATAPSRRIAGTPTHGYEATRLVSGSNCWPSRNGVGMARPIGNKTHTTIFRRSMSVRYPTKRNEDTRIFKLGRGAWN